MESRSAHSDNSPRMEPRYLSMTYSASTLRGDAAGMYTGFFTHARLAFLRKQKFRFILTRSHRATENHKQSTAKNICHGGNHQS